MDYHTLPVTYDARGYSRTRPVYMGDYGQILLLKGFDLPDFFEVHFARQAYGVPSTTAIGSENQVTVPSSLLLNYGAVYCWLFLHDTESDGETRYMIEIPVRSRARLAEDYPTPEERSAISQAIAALNEAMGKIGASAQAAETALRAAEAARNSAAAAADSATAAADSATAAADSATHADSSREKANQHATAAETAKNAAQEAKRQAEAAMNQTAQLLETISIATAAEVVSYLEIE